VFVPRQVRMLRTQWALPDGQVEGRGDVGVGGGRAAVEASCLGVKVGKPYLAVRRSKPFCSGAIKLLNSIGPWGASQSLFIPVVADARRGAGRQLSAPAIVPLVPAALLLARGWPQCLTVSRRWVHVQPLGSAFPVQARGQRLFERRTTLALRLFFRRSPTAAMPRDR